MPTNEETVKTAMADATKQPRIAKLLTALSGSNVTSIINAINGSESDFTTQLGQVEARVAQISQLQTKVDDRDKRINDLTTEINNLRQQVAGHVETISALEARVPKQNPFDA